MRNSGIRRILYGLLFVAIGIVIFGNLMHFWDFSAYAKSWWTLFIIVPGIAGIISSGFEFWNVFLVVLGCWLFAEEQGFLKGYSWYWLLAGLLILFGLSIIFGFDRHRKFSPHNYDGFKKFSEDFNDCPEYTGVFSNLDVSNKSQNFKGGKATSVFGRVTVDLRDIKIQGNAYFEASSVFGTLQIYVPKDIPVKLNIVPVFGGYHNMASFAPPDPSAPYIEIKGASVFGSIEVF